MVDASKLLVSGVGLMVLAGCTPHDLPHLEADDRVGRGPQLDLFAPVAKAEATEAVELDELGPAVDPHTDAVLSQLRTADPDDLSPREAHALLRQLRERLAATGQPQPRA